MERLSKDKTISVRAALVRYLLYAIKPLGWDKCFELFSNAFEKGPEEYSEIKEPEKSSLRDLAHRIFKTKDVRFKFAMICWSIGTLAFSIILVTYEVVPEIIGWLGIISGVLVGFGTAIKLIKPKFKGEIIGALFAMLFETLIGGWLLISPLI